MKQILLITFLLISFLSISQNTRDVVYLKNGSIIKGTITEMNPSENLKIKTADGSLFVYSMGEIIKMEKEEFIGNMVNQETSSTIGQSVINDYFTNFLSQSRPALKLIGVSKKNGVKKDVFGQKKYEIEYELIMETKENIHINASQFESINGSPFQHNFAYTLKPAGKYEAGFGGAKKIIEKGKRIVANGTLVFEETDNGWRATGLRNKNYKTVSSTYVSPEMAKQKQQDNLKKKDNLKKAGDWKKPDIPETDLKPIFCHASDVPLFEQAVIKYSFQKNCKNCRNDNIKSIRDVITKSIYAINRYESVNEDTMKSISNTATATFYINNISFNHLGVKDDGKDKGFSCEIDYTIGIISELKTPETLRVVEKKVGKAKARTLIALKTKSDAFNKALINLQTNINSFIKKNAPYSLDVVRLENDKKGKIESVIFKKPKIMMIVKKGEFLVYKKGDLTINDNKYKLKSSVGKCKFKGDINDDELTCEIRGGKSRKAFEEITNNPAQYEAVSTF